jgi:xylose isomerase
MKQKMEKTRSKYTDKFEFILRINGNIVCQRYFNIRGYNDNSKNSMELRWELGEIVDTIQSYLKQKSEDFLWVNHNPFSNRNSVVKDTKKEEEDYFTFEIRVDGKVIIIQRFTGMVFPPKIRYSVNIKSLIPSIISKIQRCLSKRKYLNVKRYYDHQTT